MFLININNILSVWTINYDISSIYGKDNFSLCNIDKDTFVYMTYRQIVYIRYRRKHLCIYYIWVCCLY